MKKACIASTETRARCRNFVEIPEEMCRLHQKLQREGKVVECAPFPNVVLVKFNINPKWVQRFKEAGIPQLFPDELSLEEQHMAQALRFRRKAYRFRNIADSGVPVFPNGVSEISVVKLLEELREEGYESQKVHIRTRERKFNVLVIPFSRGNSEESSTSLSEEAAEVLNKFLKLSCWGHAHIWANPPDNEGRIIHTINLSHREPEKCPQWNLCFNDGLWALEPFLAS